MDCTMSMETKPQLSQIEGFVEKTDEPFVDKSEEIDFGCWSYADSERLRLHLIKC